MVLQRIFRVLFLGLFFPCGLKELYRPRRIAFLTAKYLSSTPAILSLHLHRGRVMVVR